MERIICFDGFSMLDAMAFQETTNYILSCINIKNKEEKICIVEQLIGIWIENIE